jgi:hypothetical protein
MAVENSTLGAAGATTTAILVDKGQEFMFNVSGTFVGTWKLQLKSAGDTAYRDLGKSYTIPKTKAGKSPVRGHYRITMSAYTSGAAVATLYT